MTPTRAVRTALAVLFMLLFVAALAVRIWAAGEAAATVGPSHLAAGAEVVYVYAGGELLAVAPDGRLRARRAVETLGLRDAPIDLRVLPDGRLLVAGQRPATLRLCEPGVWSCIEVAPAAAARLRAQFKVLVDGDALLITDFAAGRLWRAALDGGEPQPLLAPPLLDGPNDLAFDADGRLWVADSGHRRLAVFAPGADGTWALVHSLDARQPPASPGNDWPMMLAAGADGRWWVTQPDPRGGRGELLGYHPERGAETRIALPAGADATDVVRLDGDLLVSDMERFRLYRVAGGSGKVTEFGDAALRALLADGAGRRDRYDRLAGASLVAMIAFAVLMLAAAVWATPRGRRFTPWPVAAPPLAASDAAPPPLREAYWLQRDPAAERMLRFIMPLIWVLAVLMPGLLVALYFIAAALPDDDATPTERARFAELRQVLPAGILAFGGLPLLAHISTRSMRRRLGTDGGQLLVRFEDGRQRSYLPEQLVYGGRLILFQGEAFAVQAGNRRSLYAAGEVETWIAPLLRRARGLGALALFRHQLRYREPTLMVSLAYALLLVAAVAVTGAWQPLLMPRG